MILVKKNPGKNFEKKAERNSEPNRWVYDNKLWRGKDGVRLQRLMIEPFCRNCAAPGQMVDHIKPVNEGGEPFDIENTQTLCNSCHARKSAIEGYKR
ncbi:HNH endonuclease signature motif containing protein [Emticicia fontis]